MVGPKLHSMAWRNLWRNRRRSIITVSSLAFGVLLATLLTGMNDHQWGEAIDLAAKSGTGHVAVQHPGYLDMPSMQRTVKGTTALRAKALEMPGVTHAVARIGGQVMVATAADTFGASMLAIDPAVEPVDTFEPLGKFVEGGLFDTSDGTGIVLGKKLAENLETKLGRKIVFTLTDRNGEIVNGLAHVTGILSTGSPSADAALVLLPLDTVRKLVGYEDGEATQVAVFAADQRKSKAIAATLGPAVSPHAVALDWSEVNPDLAGFVTLKVVGSLVMQVFVVFLIAAGIFNTLFVSVMERLREFGILLAIGFSPGGLFRLVLWESLWLSLVGLATGIAVTAPLYFYLSTTGIDISELYGDAPLEMAGAVIDPILKVGLYADHGVLIAVSIVFVTLIAGLYPAMRAASVQPVDAIKLR